MSHHASPDTHPPVPLTQQNASEIKHSTETIIVVNPGCVLLVTGAVPGQVLTCLSLKQMGISAVTTLHPEGIYFDNRSSPRGGCVVPGLCVTRLLTFRLCSDFFLDQNFFYLLKIGLQLKVVPAPM